MTQLEWRGLAIHLVEPQHSNTVFLTIRTPLYFSITVSNVARFEWKLHHCNLIFDRTLCRWCEVGALPDKSADSVHAFIMHLVYRFGSSHILLHDQVV